MSSVCLPVPLHCRSTLQSSGSAEPESEALFGEKVLPGSAQELRDFSQEATRKSACRVTCRLPYLLVEFPRKDVFDTVYRRHVAAVAAANQMFSGSPLPPVAHRMVVMPVVCLSTVQACRGPVAVGVSANASGTFCPQCSPLL